MFKKRLTFMLIPDSTGTARQISVPVAGLWLAASSLAVVIIAKVLFASLWVSNRVDSSELTQLRSENAQLAERYEDLRWKLSEVDARYQELIEKEIAIRTLFELPEIDLEERQLGIGGPGPLVSEPTTPLGLQAYESTERVEELLRLSSYELEKFADVEQELLELRTELAHTPSIKPSPGWFSSSFGYRTDPFTGMRQFHRGIDIANRPGTPIVATADGKVTRAVKAGNFGRMVTIDHGNGYVTRYGHLAKWTVKVGQRVERGEIIAYMGNTGRSTGPHLHYEVWKDGKAVNPRSYILNSGNNL